MSARDVIAGMFPYPLNGPFYADAILAALAVSGYRILGPDELDPVTVEKCAVVADDHTFAMDVDWWLNATKKDISSQSCLSVAAAIRALCATHQGDK